MTKRTIFFATSLFLGGFIPFKDTIQEHTTIYYQIVANPNRKDVYVQCNKVKKEMLEIYEKIAENTFTKTDEKLSTSFDLFSSELVKANYQNYVLTLSLDEDGVCCMKGILYSFDYEPKVEKTYFFEELFR